MKNQRELYTDSTQETRKRERNGYVTHVNDENRTIHKWDFVYILQKYIIQSCNCEEDSGKSKMIHQRMMSLLPCRCRTNMFSSLDTLLLDLKEWGCGEQQLLTEAIELRDLM